MFLETVFRQATGYPWALHVSAAGCRWKLAIRIAAFLPLTESTDPLFEGHYKPESIIQIRVASEPGREHAGARIDWQLV